MAGGEERRRNRERGFWGRVAPRYDSWVSSAFMDQYMVFRSRMAGYMLPDDAVLEIGSGTGDITFHMAEKGARITGIDISPEMVAEANKKKDERGAGNVTFRVGDAYALPFHDNSFDRVISVNALQAMKEPERAVEEGKRVLREGGDFITITYCYGDSGFLERMKLVQWVILYGLPRYWHNFRCGDLIRLFEKAGLEIMEEDIVWRKPPVCLVRARKTRVLEK